jgi:hypothetical protein
MHTTSTKQNLILSLLKLGSEQGLQAISLSTLAKENKISKAALYHHFASREAMTRSCSPIATPSLPADGYIQPIREPAEVPQPCHGSLA